MLKPEQHIQHQLTQAGRKLQRYKGRLLWLRAIPLWMLSVALFVALDLAFQFEPWPRVLALVLLLSGSAAFCIWALWVGYGQVADPRRVARHLESRDPSLGSSLINFLDLGDTAQDASLPALTRDMAGHAQHSHAASVSHRDLPPLVAHAKLRVTFKYFCSFIVCILIICAFAWPILRAHIPRLIAPFGNHPPYSMTTLSWDEPDSDAAPVVYGDALRLTVAVKGHHPNQVDLVYWPTARPDEVFRISMIDRGQDGFVQQIAEVNEALTLVAETQDGRSRTPERSIELILNPKLERIEVQITPPAYTGLPAVLRPYKFTELRALTGSTITLTAYSNRTLASGSIQLERPLQDEPYQTVEMTALESQSVQGVFTVEQSAGFTVSLTDSDGLHSEASPRGSIDALQDRGPSVSITEPGTMSLLALDASIEVQIEAHDDYGLAEMRIHRAINDIFGAPEVISAEPNTRRMSHQWTLDFATIGVQAEDVVTLFVEVIDQAPSPQIARTEMIRIAAVSIEDYNSLLREEVDLSRIAMKYSALRDAFDQAVIEQEAMQKAIDSLREQFAQATDPAERAALMESFEKLLKQQGQLNDQLEQIAQKLESTVRESPLYDVESEFFQRFQNEAAELREAATQNQSLQTHIQEQLKRESLSAAQQAELMKQFDQALQTQREQLVGQQAEVESASETMEDMADFHEMVKNFNRFTTLANTQRSLAEKVAAFDKSGRLDRTDQLALRDLASEQKAVADELELLSEKMRSDAEQAHLRFPKAAASSLSFAEAIEMSRAPELSQQATQAMLNSKGDQSAVLSAATSEAMESLIGQCNGGMQSMNEELDQQLSAKRSGGSAGQTFEQMLENMKMRYSSNGTLSGIGKSGRGRSGNGGSYSVNTGSTPSLLGNESLAAEGESATRNDATAGNGNGEGRSQSSEVIDASGAPGTLSEMEEQRRQSESVRAESLFIEHDSIVDAYFKKITEESP
jgi:hypothetical protein